MNILLSYEGTLISVQWYDVHFEPEYNIIMFNSMFQCYSIYLQCQVYHHHIFQKVLKMGGGGRGGVGGPDEVEVKYKLWNSIYSISKQNTWPPKRFFNVVTKQKRFGEEMKKTKQNKNKNKTWFTKGEKWSTNEGKKNPRRKTNIAPPRKKKMLKVEGKIKQKQKNAITLKITFFVNMWNLGQFLEKLIFCYVTCPWM